MVPQRPEHPSLARHASGALEVVHELPGHQIELPERADRNPQDPGSFGFVFGISERHQETAY